MPYSVGPTFVFTPYDAQASSALIYTAPSLRRNFRGKKTSLFDCKNKIIN